MSHHFIAVRAPSQRLRVLVVRTDFLRRGIHARDQDSFAVCDCRSTAQTGSGMVTPTFSFEVQVERHLTLLQLDLTTLITQKGIPIGLTHLDSFVRAKQYSETFKTSLNLQGKPGLNIKFTFAPLMRVIRCRSVLRCGRHPRSPCDSQQGQGGPIRPRPHPPPAPVHHAKEQPELPLAEGLPQRLGRRSRSPAGDGYPPRPGHHQLHTSGLHLKYHFAKQDYSAMSSP